jgi:hypothetical protein
MQAYGAHQQYIPQQVPMNAPLNMYQQWGAYPQPSAAVPQQNFGVVPVDPIDRAISSPSRPNNHKSTNNGTSKLNSNTQVAQLQQQLSKEKMTNATLEAELKVKNDEVTALKASNNAIVTAAVQLQPLLQQGYIMPETLQQFNYFVYQARMKLFEDQQREQLLEQQKETEMVSAAAKKAKEEAAAAKKAASAKAKELRAAQEKVAAAKAEAAAAAAATAKAEAEAEAAAKAEADKAAAESPITGLPAYDPHAAPIVFGSRRGNMQNHFVNDLEGSMIANTENVQPVTVQQAVQAPVQPPVQAPVQQAVQTPVHTPVQQAAPVEQPKVNRGWETAKSVEKPAAKSPLQEKKIENAAPIAAPIAALVAPPKPTSWAGLVGGSASNSEENQQAVSNVPAPAPAAIKAPVKEVIKTETRERKEGGKGGKGKGGKGERRERRSGKGERGGKGKGRNGNRSKHTHNKNTLSPAEAQAKADREYARQLQAQINGTQYENQWECQSKKGSARPQHIVAAGDFLP